MKILSVTFLLALFASLTALADAAPLGSFTYRVYFPKNLNCAAELAKVSAQFKAQTGLEVTSQYCLALDSSSAADPTFKINAGVIVYLSTGELIVNPVLFGEKAYPLDSVGYPLGLAGIYKNFASCVADIATQAQIFSSVTGTEPVAVYCMPGEVIPDTYVLHIDSFKDQKMRLFVFEAFQGLPNAQAFAAVMRLFSNSGAVVAKLAGNFIYFYDSSPSPLDWSPAHIHFKNIIAGILETEAQCANELQVVTTALAAAPTTSIVATCTKSPNYGSPAIELSGDLSHLGLGSAGRSYFSMAECLQDKERALAEYSKTSAPGALLGGFCSFWNVNQYRLQTLEKF